MNMSNAAQEPVGFSLVLGGPFYQLFRRAHLSGTGLELLRRRIIVISMFAWLPLLLLSALNGQLLDGAVAVPFLLDVEVHVRFLIAMPLLIVAEIVVHRRMHLVVRQFLERKLIAESARTRFDSAIASALRLRNSVPAELLLVALVYGVGVFIVWRVYTVLDTSTWQTLPAEDTGRRLSAAGIWYAYVSLPLFQFMLLRWYFRIFIWLRFLWQVSRIDLNLLPIHPDRVGGLGFLSNTAYAFVPLALAHGAVLSGQIANRIFHLGAELLAFKIEIALVVCFVQVLVFAPLLLFSLQLAQAKRVGLREYGTLAARYIRDFDSKWLRGNTPVKEPLVGSADVQSLADMGNSFEGVRKMRAAPVTRDAIVELAAATAVPLAPLLLTIMPLEELVKRLAGILF